MCHLLGKPFDVAKDKGKLLHYLELLALCVAWSTFWSGAMFYILIGDESKTTRICITIFIVLINFSFLVFSCYEFVKELMVDMKYKDEKIKTNRKSLVGVQKVVPLNKSGNYSQSKNTDVKSWSS